MKITAYALAERFVGLKEVPGAASNPHVLAMLRIDEAWPASDDVPWCSAFCNYVAWLLNVPRSKSLAARSWLKVGIPISVDAARVGWDVVILSRGIGKQPGPNVIDAPGHVGFFAGWQGDRVHVLGGNQSNSVSLESYPVDRILGIRRIAPPGISE